MNPLLMLFLSLVASAQAQTALITKLYTNYLKDKVQWVVQEYENNIFKDWTDDDIRKMLGDQIVSMADTETFVAPPLSNTSTEKLPDTQDWSSNTCAHPIRNQGSCGGCWAFAVSSVVSDRCCLQGRDHGWLSPQELISCDTANSGCTGGDRGVGMRYVADKGLVTEECFPYAATKSDCPNKCADGKDWGTSHVCKCTNIRLCSGESGLRSCLSTGPVAVGMTVYADLLYYKSGVYKWDGKSELKGYHAVRMVGYGPGYWKCANTWGAGWGMDGYFMIARGDCGIEARNPVTCDPVP